MSLNIWSWKFGLKSLKSTGQHVSEPSPRGPDSWNKTLRFLDLHRLIWPWIVLLTSHKLSTKFPDLCCRDHVQHRHRSAHPEEPADCQWDHWEGTSSLILSRWRPEDRWALLNHAVALFPGGSEADRRGSGGGTRNGEHDGEVAGKSQKGESGESSFLVWCQHVLNTWIHPRTMIL